MYANIFSKRFNNIFVRKMRQVSHVFPGDFKPETSALFFRNSAIPWFSGKPSNEGSDTLDRVAHLDLALFRNSAIPLCTTLSLETSTSSSVSPIGSRTSEKLMKAAL